MFIIISVNFKSSTYIVTLIKKSIDYCRYNVIITERIKSVFLTEQNRIDNGSVEDLLNY